MDELTKYDLIERYLSKELSGEELQNFEEKISNDDELKMEINLHQQLAETLKGDDIHDFRNKIKSVDSQWERPGEKQNGGQVFRLNFRKVMAIAAGVALLIFAGQYLFSEGQSSSPEQLFANHYEPYQMVLNQRSIDDEENSNTLINHAVQAYANGNYGEAAETFNRLLEPNPDNVAFKFYEAISHLSDNKPTTAIPIFESLVSQSGHLFEEQSRWYLALAYLKNGEKEKAVSSFNQIQEGEFKFGEKKEILEGLD